MLTGSQGQGDKEWEATGPDQLASHSLSPLTVRTGRGTSPRRRYITVEREQIGCPWRRGVAVRAFARQAKTLAGNCSPLARQRLSLPGEYRQPLHIMVPMQ